MAFSTFFTLFIFLQATLAGHGYHQRHREAMQKVEEKMNLLRERQGGGSIVTTGVQGSVARRLEIRGLEQNSDQWNLYLLGMRAFMDMDQSDPLSFYQIVGIHGVPFISWNDVPEVHSAGFAPHVSTMFWPWHRIFLAMFEQCWYSHVQDVVNSFPASERSRWQAAADSLRLPYWDPAMAPPTGETAVPMSIRTRTITVTGPNGQQQIENPLYQYTFHPVSDELGDPPYNQWPNTFRRPVENPLRSNNNEFASEVDNNRITLRDRLYNLFVSGAPFVQVQTEAVGPGTGVASAHDSFESWHDSIHSYAGGPTGGNMYYLDESAFDPVFWLHHCNVDRHMAMYQVLRPDEYVGEGDLNSDTWQWSQGDVKNSQSPLIPFAKDSNGDYFTSDDIRDTSTLGYVYPETDSGATPDSLTEAVNALYGPGSTTSKRDETYSFNETSVYEGRPYEKGDHTYILNINAHKHSLGGTYTIYAFFGNVSDNVSSWTISPNFVGSLGVLSHKNPTNTSAVEIEGAIPLTTRLQDQVRRGALASLSPVPVSAYLMDTLSYRVVKAGGDIVPPDQVPGLHVTVSTVPVEPAESSQAFPQWVGDMITLTNITANMPAGTPYVPSSFIPLVGNNTVPLGQPNREQASCVVQRYVEYVDTEGNFLYSEKQ